MADFLKTNRIDCLVVFVGCVLGATVLALMFEQPVAKRSQPVGAVDLPDFSVYQDISTRKARFFEFLQPIAEAENRAIQSDRDKLQKLYDKLRSGRKLRRPEREWLQALATRYRVQWHELAPVDVVRELLTRVDTVPIPLVLVQAAKESAWGRSRFARQANNLFGEWCYEQGCGMVPARRGADQRHEVRAFDTVRDALASYMRNLNSHPRYAQLRQLRAELREKGRPVTALALAPGLLYYSERREAYITEVRAMIRQYHRFQSQRKEG